MITFNIIQQICKVLIFRVKINRFYVKHFTDSGLLKENKEGVRRGQV